MSPSLAFLSIVFGFSAASVDFTYSTLYDIYDFRGEDEVPLPQCDNGCLIFASTMGPGFIDSPTDHDPYAENLIIHDNESGKNMSITDLSFLYDANTSQKKPLSFAGPAKITVLNLNSHNDTYWPIVLYVLQNNKDVKFTFDIYDALNMKGVFVNAGISTVMCAYPFTLTAKGNNMPNIVTARLVGADNMKNENIDDCPVAYSTPLVEYFDGFTLHIAGPMISISCSGALIDADLQFIPLFDLDTDGFITSDGYNGCRKPKSGGVQSFRSGFFHSSGVYTISSNDDKYNVTLDIVPNLDEYHSVTVSNAFVPNDYQFVSGYDEVQIEYDDTDYVNVVFNNITGDQGFLMRYSAVAEPRPLTTPLTTNVPSSTSTSTSTTQTPTTSGSAYIGNALLTFVTTMFFSRLM